ncbi:MAG: 50S ribosomal protein L14e [Nanoarchaeota archaeon]
MIGRVCIKLTGREAGKYCVVVNNLDDNFVLIDGNIKRRKCNINHLEFTDKVLNIKKDASTKEVLEAMNKENIKVIKLKEAKKEIKEKPNKKRKSKNLENKPEDNKANKNVKTKK